MTRSTLCALLFVGAALYLGEASALPGQPKQKQPKVEPKDPKTGLPVGADGYLGTWKLVGKNLKQDEEFTVTFEKGEWKLTGVYKVDGKEVGKFHGEKIAVTKNALRFTHINDDKKSEMRITGVLTAKDEKGKIAFTGTVEKGTHFWGRDYERTEKGTAVAIADPKPDPKIDPKTDPKPDPKTQPKTDPKVDPKTEPKVDDPLTPAGPYSVIATVKNVHNGVLSPDGSMLYGLNFDTTANSKSLVAFDVKKKEVVKRIKLEFPDRIALSEDGKRVVVCDYVNFAKKDYATKVYVYDTATWEAVGEFDHPKAGSRLAVSRDGVRVAVGGGGGGGGPEDPGTINVWDVAKKKVLFTATTGAVMDLSADGKTLVMNAFGADKGSIGFIDVDSGKAKAAIKGLAERLAITADGKMAVGAMGNKLSVYDAVKKTVKELPPPGPGGISSVALVDNNKRVIVGGTISESLVVPLDGGKAEKPFKLEPEKGPKGLPKGGGGNFQAEWLRPTPDGSLLLTVGADRVARIWTLPFGEKK